MEAGPDYPDFDRLPDKVKYGYATATDVMTSDHKAIHWKGYRLSRIHTGANGQGHRVPSTA